jgi:hypothetical protein
MHTENTVESPEAGLLSNLPHDDHHEPESLSAECGQFSIFESELSDGSMVYGVVGDSEQGRITINCVDSSAASIVCDTLNNGGLIVGISLERA